MATDDMYRTVCHLLLESINIRSKENDFGSFYNKELVNP